VAAERRSVDLRCIAVHAAPAGSRAGVRTGRDREARSCGEQEQSETELRQLPRPADGAIRPRILVIDDDEALCEVIRQTLHEDYAVASAPHGAAALELLAEHEPALILLDLRMPIMDGWSFVHQYRRLAAVPAAIVLMSAASDLPNIAIQLGANGHLKKPIDLPELQRCVATQLDGHASRPRTDVPGADRPSSPPLN
jgi:two-component system response regulator MprA